MLESYCALYPSRTCLLTSRSCPWRQSRLLDGAIAASPTTTRIIVTAGRARKTRTTGATIARSGILGLLSPTPNASLFPQLSHRHRHFRSIFDAPVEVA